MWLFSLNSCHVWSHDVGVGQGHQEFCTSSALRRTVQDACMGSPGHTCHDSKYRCSWLWRTCFHCGTHLSRWDVATLCTDFCSLFILMLRCAKLQLCELAFRALTCENLDSWKLGSQQWLSIDVWLFSVAIALKC